MLPLLVVCLIIKHTLGAPMALIGFATSHVVAAFRHSRLLGLWSSVLFMLLGWSLGVSYPGSLFFRPGAQRLSTPYAIGPVRPIQTRQLILSCCCPGTVATEDPPPDAFWQQVARMRALHERLTARHGLHLLSRKEISITVPTTGRRLRLSDTYDAYCNRCPAPSDFFPDDPGSTLIPLIHGSIRLPPRESP